MSKCSFCCGSIDTNNESHVKLDDEYICKLCANFCFEKLLIVLEDRLNHFYVVPQPDLYVNNGAVIGNSHKMTEWELLKALEQYNNLEVIER